jgi:hypothetical protein
MILNFYEASRPAPLAAKIEKWRDDARRFRAHANAARENKKVRADRLIEIEKTAEEIHHEISVLNARLPLAGEMASAAKWAEDSDALRLVLMEITDLSAAMYTVRSVEGTTQSGSSPGL